MIQKNKLVSILIITFNAEEFIEKTIKSCLKQTYDNVEILILDNNSKDSTVRLIDKINDKRLKIFNSSENLGPYGGLNFLLDKASGDYIAIQDHDDIWFPEKIEKQVNFMENNTEFIGCGTVTWYYFEEKEILILNKRPKETNFVDHTSLVFRNNNFRYDTSHSLADEYFEKIILAKQGLIHCLQEGLTIHRLKKEGVNLSNSRFNLSSKLLKEFFHVNNFNWRDLVCLVSMLLNKHLPRGIVWFFRLKVVQRNNTKLSLSEFKTKYPKIEL